MKPNKYVTYLFAFVCVVFSGKQVRAQGPPQQGPIQTNYADLTARYFESADGVVRMSLLTGADTVIAVLNYGMAGAWNIYLTAPKKAGESKQFLIGSLASNPSDTMFRVYYTEGKNDKSLYLFGFFERESGDSTISIRYKALLNEIPNTRLNVRYRIYDSELEASFSEDISYPRLSSVHVSIIESITPAAGKKKSEKPLTEIIGTDAMVNIDSLTAAQLEWQRNISIVKKELQKPDLSDEIIDSLLALVPPQYFYRIRIPVYHQNGLLAMYNYSDSYLGGAHGYDYYEIEQFDLQTGRKLKAADIFEKTKIPALEKKIYKDMTGSKQAWTTDDERASVRDNNILIWGNKVFLSYPAYEMNSYANGQLSKGYTFRQLSSFLNKQGTPAPYFKRHK